MISLPATVHEVAFDAWNQLVVVRDAQGFQKFYLNGTLVHSDRQAEAAGKVRPFRDTAAGEPVSEKPCLAERQRLYRFPTAGYDLRRF